MHGFDCFFTLTLLHRGTAAHKMKEYKSFAQLCALYKEKRQQ